MARERAAAERDEQLRRVRAQAADWRARAKVQQANAQALIATRRVAARIAQARAARLQRAAVSSFNERVAERREEAVRVVERVTRTRGGS